MQDCWVKSAGSHCMFVCMCVCVQVVSVIEEDLHKMYFLLTKVNCRIQIRITVD